MANATTKIKPIDAPRVATREALLGVVEVVDAGADEVEEPAADVELAGATLVVENWLLQVSVVV